MKTATEKKIFDVLSNLSSKAPDGLHWDEFAAREIAKALEAEAAQVVEPVAQSIITALRFYGNAEHYSLDDEEDFDTVSGEPENWLCSGVENSATMVEDGSIARRALRGEPIVWVDGDEDETPKPIDGEATYTAPQEPAAPDLDLYRRALLNTHGDTWREEMSAAIATGVVPQEPAAPAAWTEARIREVASEAAERVGKNASIAHQLCFPHIYLTLKDAFDPAAQIAQNVIAKAAGIAS